MQLCLFFVSFFFLPRNASKEKFCYAFTCSSLVFIIYEGCYSENRYQGFFLYYCGLPDPFVKDLALSSLTS